MKKDLIDYMLSKSGKLGENETWYDIAVKFNFQVPDKERAKTDKKYARECLKKAAHKVWKRYVAQQAKLKLDKQIYVDGKLKFETFKNKPEPAGSIDHTQYEIDRITTNPYGGAWYKMKRKEDFHTEKHLEILKEMLTEKIEPVIIDQPQSSANKALFIYGSDKHIGALTKVNSVYKNKYDREEIKRRLVLLTLHEIERAKHLHGTFDALFIMDLGDALDGFEGKTTRGLSGASGHTLPQQLNNRDQHDFYVEVTKLLFDSLAIAGYSKKIYFVATSNSNHGGDFEYGAMRHLETYLNVKYPEISTVVNVFPLNHFTYGKHAIIFGHGKDDEDMRAGLPLTLNDKVEKYVADYIRVNKLEDYNVTLVSGDLHQSAETYGNNFRYKKVLSQYGSTKWMHTNFGSGSPGLTSEVMERDSSRIHKMDEFFKIGEQSNTGIKF